MSAKRVPGPGFLSPAQYARNTINASGDLLDGTVGPPVSASNYELREDGGLELREDGGTELRE